MDEIRQTIDAIDRQMAALYEQRMDAVKQVAEYKYNNNGKIFDPERENVVVEKNLAYLKNHEYDDEYRALIHFIMDQSKAYQQAFIEEKAKENH